MASHIVNNLLSYLPGNTTEIVGEATAKLTSIAMGVLSELPYSHIGGAGLVIGWIEVLSLFHRKQFVQFSSFTIRGAKRLFVNKR